MSIHSQTQYPAVLLDELQATRPLSVLMAEPVAQLRHWARDRARPAD